MMPTTSALFNGFKYPEKGPEKAAVVVSQPRNAPVEIKATHRITCHAKAEAEATGTDLACHEWLQAVPMGVSPKIPSNSESMVSASMIASVVDENANNRDIGAKTPSTPQQGSEDLVIFDDAVDLSQRVPQFGQFTAKVHVLHQLDPFDSEDLITFSDDGNDDIAAPTFGLIDGPSKDVRFTMKQQTGRRAKAQTSSKGSAASAHPQGPSDQIVRHVARVEDVDQKRIDEGETHLTAEYQVFDLAIIMQMAVGDVSIELDFGRIYIKQLSHGLVSTGDGPRERISEMTGFLNQLPEDQVSFSTVLTINGGEASALVNIPAPGATPWKRYSSRHVYVFECKLLGHESQPFRVEVDAEKFHHRIRGMVTTIATVYVHCARHTWDFRVRGTRCDILDQEGKHASFAQSLVAGLRVKTDDIGNAILTVEKTTRQLGGSIKDAHVRHTARYRNGSNSVLAITMFRTIHQQPAAGKVTFHGSTYLQRAGRPGAEQPTQWYEMNITSTTALEVLKQNASLRFGDRTQWTPESLQEMGVFQDLCKPALGMIPHMDSVGMWNNNGQSIRENPATRMMPDMKRKKEVVSFW